MGRGPSSLLWFSLLHCPLALRPRVRKITETLGLHSFIVLFILFFHNSSVSKGTSLFEMENKKCDLSVQMGNLFFFRGK